MKIKLTFCALALTFAASGGTQAQTAAPAPTSTAKDGYSRYERETIDLVLGDMKARVETEPEVTVTWFPATALMPVL